MSYIIRTEEGHRVGNKVYKTRAAAKTYITKLTGGEGMDYFYIEEVSDNKFGIFGA